MNSLTYLTLIYFSFSYSVYAVNKSKPEIILRPAHLEGVPLERDGSLNSEFRREILLGNLPSDKKLHNVDHEDETSEQIKEQIRRMFKIADTNKDGFLDRNELQQQIEKNTKQHLDDAVRESQEIFQIIDEDGNGRISWHEYREHILKEFKESDHPRDLAQIRSLMVEKKAFEKADAEQDGLDEVEWLGFRHPEQSAVLLKSMVNELLRDRDHDGDNKLTIDEFSMPLKDENAESSSLQARRYDFQKLVDRNNDGYADERELQDFIDPRSPQRTADEVKDIFVLFDGDGDDLLSLNEMLARSDLLGMSGFIHANIRLHDDL